MSYFEVPADVLEDAEECVVWSLRAVAAGRATPNGKKSGAQSSSHLYVATVRRVRFRRRSAPRDQRQQGDL